MDSGVPSLPQGLPVGFGFKTGLAGGDGTSRLRKIGVDLE